jgi:carbon-monoxide dehydrogenase medium subunit
MYPAKYHRPANLAEAVADLKAAEEAVAIAGGQTLLPTMKQRLAMPSDLIDLRGLSELKGIDVSGGTVTVGAATTHAEVAAHAGIRAAIPALACLAAGIGDPAVRHMGTIGGSLANNDPAADYPAAVLGLGATVVTDRREIAADDFFEGMFTTALEEGEIIVSVRFEAPEAAAYQKFANPASRYALVGVFVARTGGGVRVAVTGAGADGVFRHDGMEQALGARFAPEAVEGTSVDEAQMASDIHASPAYRAHLIKVMARRAVAGAS